MQLLFLSIVVILLIISSILMVSRKSKHLFLTLLFLFPLVPQYFSFKILSFLPLLTIQRTIIIILFINIIINRRSIFEGLKRVVDLKKLKNILYVLAILYFLPLVLSFLRGLLVQSIEFSSVTTIIGALLDYYLLTFIILIYLPIAGFHNSIKSLISSFVLICLLSIPELTSGLNMFAYLNLGYYQGFSDFSEGYQRLGEIRVKGPFNHAIGFAMVLTLIIPITIYYYRFSNKKRFLLISFLFLLMLLFTYSRGPLVSIAISGILAVVLYLLLILYKGKTLRVSRSFYLVPSILFIILNVLIIMWLAIPQLKEGMFFSLYLNVLTIFDPNNAMVIDTYGVNNDAYSYRLTLILAVASQLSNLTDWLFGKGPGYLSHTEGISYSDYRVPWEYFISIDNQYLITLLETGLVGILATIIIYLLILPNINSGKKKLGVSLWISLIAYMISLISAAEIGTYQLFIIISSISLYKKILKEGNKVNHL